MPLFVVVIIDDDTVAFMGNYFPRWRSGQDLMRDAT